MKPLVCRELAQGKTCRGVFLQSSTEQRAQTRWAVIGRRLWKRERLGLDLFHQGADTFSVKRQKSIHEAEQRDAQRPDLSDPHKDEYCAERDGGRNAGWAWSRTSAS